MTFTWVHADSNESLLKILLDSAIFLRIYQVQIFLEIKFLFFLLLGVKVIKCRILEQKLPPLVKVFAFNWVEDCAQDCF